VFKICKFNSTNFSLQNAKDTGLDLKYFIAYITMKKEAEGKPFNEEDNVLVIINLYFTCTQWLDL
jgi:hypothetical protein